MGTRKARPGLPVVVVAMTGWVPHMESQRRSERTREGLAPTLAQRKRLGKGLRFQRQEEAEKKERQGSCRGDLMRGLH